MPFVVGFVTFALVNLYRDQDISKWLRTRTDSALATKGWHFEGDMDLVSNRGPVAAVARFLWKMSSCAYCLGVWVSFAVTWYALGRHPWRRKFWLTWFSAWGTHVMLTTVYQSAHEATEAINKYLLPPVPDVEQPEREPDPAEMV